MEKIDLILAFVLRVSISIFFVIGLTLYLFLVVGRAFFGLNFLWIPPVIQYLFIVAALYGGGLASATNEHMKIDFIKPLMRHPFCQCISALISAGITVMILILFWQHLHLNFVAGIASEVFLPVWVTDVPFLILFSISLYYYVRRLYECSKACIKAR